MNIRRRTFLLGCGAAAAAAGGLFLRKGLSFEGEELSGDGHLVGAGAMPPDGPSGLDFFALGDIGWNSPERKRVIERMVATASIAKPSFVALLGDNFYREGVASADDPRWQTDFEQAFPESGLNVPFVAALGNHDHNGSIDAQVEYTKRSRRWTMPGRYHKYERQLGASDQHAALFFVDTTPFRTEWNGAREQTEWLDAELAKCRARWRIVIGHHPILSHGEHGGSSIVARELVPLFERHGVHLYLSGHDHDLQLIRSRTNWCQIVSGAGSSTREVGRGRGTEFALAEPGFAWLRLTETSAHVEFVGAETGPRGAYRIDRAVLVG